MSPNSLTRAARGQKHFCSLGSSGAFVLRTALRMGWGWGIVDASVATEHVLPHSVTLPCGVVNIWHLRTAPCLSALGFVFAPSSVNVQMDLPSLQQRMEPAASIHPGTPPYLAGRQTPGLPGGLLQSTTTLGWGWGGCAPDSRGWPMCEVY